MVQSWTEYAMTRKLLRNITCAVVGFCLGMLLSSFIFLPDSHCVDPPSSEQPEPSAVQGRLSPGNVEKPLSKRAAVAPAAGGAAAVTPNSFSATTRIYLPPDKSPPVAFPEDKDRAKRDGGDDGPMHRPDDSALKKEFSVEMKVESKHPQELHFGNRPLTVTEELGLHKTLYVGVVTAKKYFRTRATAINNTWGRYVPKVNFFAPGADSPEGAGLPIISMDGVDDSYPPQKKVFSMLKYMCDNLKDEFDWFLRADDDLFLRPEELMQFLHTLDPQKPIYMGQPGIGFKRDRDRLKLKDGEVYCMGGTGVFYSRSALERIRPHLDTCLDEVMSYHEDVEVGRCVSRKAGLQCTWNYELGKILYYDISEKMFRGEDIPSDAKTQALMTRALTLHPVKDPPMFYRLQKFYTELRITNTYKKLENLRLQRQALCLYMPSNAFPEFHQYWPVDAPAPYKPKNRFDVLNWEYFNNKTLFQNVEQLPSVGLSGSNKVDTGNAVKTAIQLISQLHDNQRIASFTLVNGYRRLDPVRGVDYIMDISAKLGSGDAVEERVKFLRPFGDVQLVDELKIDPYVAINIIVPISGIPNRFKEFLANYEKVCLQKTSPTKLVVVIFGESKADFESLTAVLEPLKRRYPKAIISSVTVKGKFSRAGGLDAGAKTVGPKELMFFVDADLDFKENFLRRCRRNTALGAQAYFPVTFMLFNPEIVYPGGKTVPKEITITRDTGHWATYAFGMVCMYRKDYDDVGGFDLSIKGWGAEDVKFFDKVVASNIRTFRAVDPDLIHRFHMKKCDPNLSKEQFRMCIGALAEGYASKTQLANLYLKSEMSKKSPAL
eukprot:scpid40344/ scgid16230/ Chondroitin sulfate synthase 1; Chondroitin glucuronyltransferase 1; Chondroitin synthase 1; Glucuronosyl-N-acetylgalactosaminyl-proteoglycan 4-beta-N-acetylgalactosaminyltransferase 1; N-acetylgalactosaminyl-proteoglycan 3-beta-glucuronosyltransferase 1; N-acetylgalactosaminyltransferase 1